MYIVLSNLFKHPYIRKQWRSVVLAGVLLLAGLCKLFLSIVKIVKIVLKLKAKAFLQNFITVYNLI